MRDDLPAFDADGAEGVAQVLSRHNVISCRTISTRQGVVARIHLENGISAVLKVSSANPNEVATEAAVLRLLPKPYGDRIIEYVEQNGSSALLLNWVEGDNMARVVTDSDSTTALHKLMPAIVQRIDEIHNAGVVHGDLQPTHIRVGSDSVDVIDFGVAGESGSHYGGGLVHFITPENARRKLEGKAPIRSADSDWYAAAASIFISISGVTPVAYGGTRPSLEEKLEAIAGRRFRHGPNDTQKRLLGMLSSDPASIRDRLMALS